MFRLLLGACLLLSACSQVSRVASRNTHASVPRLRIAGDSTDLAIQNLAIRVHTIGATAYTTFDITFHNPGDRVLEGELECPLSEGQQVVRYALEIEGALREGVIVEKKTARVAFENTVRRKIDPGLVEVTRGNAFRTRIYPVPARGTRRIVIGIEQAMAYAGTGFQYTLSLPAGVPRLALQASVQDVPLPPDLTGNTLKAFRFRNTGTGYGGSCSATAFSGGDFRFLLPYSRTDKPLVSTGRLNDTTYFHAHLLTAGSERPKRKPSSIALLWDVSGSASRRNREQERAFLRHYLKQLEEVQVTVVPFHIAPMPATVLQVTGGDATALIRLLDHLEPDGGTQLGALTLHTYNVDEYLLFSDGLSNFGEKDLKLPDRPLITVNSAPEADHGYLLYCARQTGGRYINLAATGPEQGAAQAALAPFRVVGLRYDSSEVEDVVTSMTGLDREVRVAGRLKKKEARITVQLGYGPGEVVTEQEWRLQDGGSSDSTAARLYARLKIANLELRYDRNKEAITQLGKTFGLVTRNTSLLVLDRVEDYVEHRILPPAGLQKEYFALLRDRQQEEAGEKDRAMNEALEAMDELKKWYTQKTPAETGRTLPPPLPSPDDEDVQIETITMEGTADQAISAPPTYRFSAPEGVAADSAVVYQNSPGAANELQDVVVNLSSAEEPSATPGRIIDLEEWVPDAPYRKALETAAADRRYEVYLTWKKDYGSQPAYFIDAARIFLVRGDTASALRVLSNVAELKLEDAELLRIMAYGLTESGHTQLAVAAFREILSLREEDPQSYRDLALALQQAGGADEAAQLFYRLITGSWDERFGDVKAIALNELNALLSSTPRPVNTAGIDPRFIYPMPVDLRIVVGWSADNSDVDLWITDPARFKCTYQNRYTPAGGKLSADVTQGYGPEEFCIRKGTRGTYQVEVNLYGDSRQTAGGPVTIKADVFTDFGKPTQKQRTINFRVTEPKDVVRIGEVVL
ncbi:MAG TPA: VIT domain-containing protein [Chitinophagaceae bacterium]|nr:VIT domain-containing protein [Chitinophagaceae bacterium]